MTPRRFSEVRLVIHLLDFASCCACLPRRANLGVPCRSCRVLRCVRVRALGPAAVCLDAGSGNLFRHRGRGAGAANSAQLQTREQWELEWHHGRGLDCGERAAGVHDDPAHWGPRPHRGAHTFDGFRRVPHCFRAVAIAAIAAIARRSPECGLKRRLFWLPLVPHRASPQASS